MKRFVILLFLLLLCCISIASAEEILILPDDLTSIEDEAFAGDVSLGTVILPNGVTSIGERAFAESSVTSITLPDTLQAIGTDAFADCTNLIVTVYENSLGHLYCVENNIPYKLLSEETQLYASLYPRVWDDICAIVAPFEDSNGSVTADERPIVLETVGKYIKELYDNGTVTEYTIGDTCIGYRLKGISMKFHYGPHVENTLSGGGDVSYSVYAVHPYSNNPDEDLGSKENGIADKIASTFEIHHRSTSHEGTQVDLNAINTFSSDEVILWCGHGHELEDGTHWLGIGVKAGKGSEAFYQYCVENGLLDTQVTEYAGRYAVNADYIRNHCGDLSGSLIWLGACHSAQDSSLSSAFLACGAEAVVGYSDEVCYLYHDEIFTATMNRMMECDENTQEYYTLSEALRYATNLHGISDPYLTKNGLYAQPILNGDGSYRLLELTTVNGTVYEKHNNSSERTPLEGAHVKFICNDCGDVVTIVSTESDGTFSINLYEGNYTVEATADDHEPDDMSLHLKGDITTNLVFNLNLIEGSVAGAFTDSFTTDVVEGVALSIANADKEVVWTGSTDADGFYRAYLAPGSYTMSASKEGFESASYSFTIKADTQTTMNKTLQRITGTLNGRIMDHLKGFGVNQGVFEIHNINGDSIYIKTTDTSGNFTIDLAPGNYTIRFPEPFFSTNAYFTTDDSYSITIIAEQETYIECIPKNTHRYEVLLVSGNFDETSQRATEKGAHIATISSAEENDLIQDFLLSNPGVSTAHIGLTDQTCEEEWLWGNGESVTYTNWSANEPNSENDETDYVRISQDDGTWIASKWITYHIREWDDPENTYIK